MAESNVDRIGSQSHRVEDFLSKLPASDQVVIVLNHDRRIIYERHTAQLDADDHLGDLPGDLFHCIHACETPQGCGSSDSCGLCGANAAIRRCFEEEAQQNLDCVIQTDIRSYAPAHNFRVCASPFLLDDELFAFVTITDISSEKRRQALERVFYHDILNTASGLKVYIDLLKHDDLVPESKRIVAHLEEISNGLIEEIQSHRTLTAAETHTLTTESNLILSSSIIERVAQQFAGDASTRGTEIRVAALTESVPFISDETLVRRVLTNMVKNALEASDRGDTVTVGCRGTASGVTFFVHNASAIPDDVQKQLFRRFYSTKGESRGLGTYSMMLLARNYLEGIVRFTSNESDGTTFYLELPLGDINVRQ